MKRLFISLLILLLFVFLLITSCNNQYQDESEDSYSSSTIDEVNPPLDDNPDLLSADYSPYFDEKFLYYNDNYLQYINDNFLADFLAENILSSHLFENDDYEVLIADDQLSAEVKLADGEYLFTMYTSEKYDHLGDPNNVRDRNYEMSRIIDIIFFESDVIGVVEGDIRLKNKFISGFFNANTGERILTEVEDGLEMDLTYIPSFIITANGVFEVSSSIDSRHNLSYSYYYSLDNDVISPQDFDYMKNYTIENTVVSPSKSYIASYNTEIEAVDIYNVTESEMVFVRSLKFNDYLKFPLSESVEISDNGEVVVLEYGDEPYEPAFDDFEILEVGTTADIPSENKGYISDLNTVTITDFEGNVIDSFSSLEHIDIDVVFLVTNSIHFLTEDIILVAVTDVFIPGSEAGSKYYYLYDISAGETIDLSENGFEFDNVFLSNKFVAAVGDGFLFAKGFTSEVCASYYLFVNNDKVYLQYFSPMNHYSIYESIGSENGEYLGLYNNALNMIDVYRITDGGLKLIESVSPPGNEGFGGFFISMFFEISNDGEVLNI